MVGGNGTVTGDTLSLAINGRERKLSGNLVAYQPPAAHNGIAIVPAERSTPGMEIPSRLGMPEKSASRFHGSGPVWPTRAGLATLNIGRHRHVTV